MNCPNCQARESRTFFVLKKETRKQESILESILNIDLSGVFLITSERILSIFVC